MEEFYTQFEQNPNSSCGCLHIRKGCDNKDIEITNINGDKVILTNGKENHAWSIKNMDEKLLKVLEFDEIRARLAKFAVSSRAKV